MTDIKQVGPYHKLRRKEKKKQHQQGHRKNPIDR